MEISNSLKTRVYEYIKSGRLLNEYDTVQIGVSGGADSVCLLFLLLELSQKLQIQVEAMHVHHGIRGGRADSDEEFVRLLCKKLNVPLTVRHVDAPAYAVENSLSLEEAARILRYEALCENQETKIAVAHHRNDQAETVLFQLLRGSGIRGLGGMRPKRDRIIRPLLCLSREEILSYLSENNIDYITDETNEDNTYSRNQIRNEVLPKLTSIQPQAIKHIAAVADDLQQVDAYLRGRAETECGAGIHQTERGVEIEIAPFLGADFIIRRTAIALVLESLVPGRRDLQRSHIVQIAELAEKESGREISLPYGMRARREGDRLVIEREPEKAKEPMKPVAIEAGESYSLQNGNVLATRLIPVDKNLQIPRDTYTKWFDYGKIKSSLQLRNRKSGDYLCIDVQMHHKKLQDYLVNRKIPASRRDEYLLLADGDHILWIIGERISEYYKVSEETEYILEVKYQEAAYERNN